MTTGVPTRSCPDRPGLVHAVSGYLVSVRADIVESAQFEDVEAQALARAIRWHAERRVLLDGIRTVVVR